LLHKVTPVFFTIELILPSVISCKGLEIQVGRIRGVCIIKKIS